jgi:outer membrane protein insertion porin family
MFFTAAKHVKYLAVSLTLAASLTGFISCTVIKNYPVNKPFVYKTNINIEGKYTKGEKKQLKSQLEQQLHDSVRARGQQKFIFWYTIKKPPVFDTMNVGKSKIFLDALLNSEGYYRDTITADTTLKIEGDQYRTTINFNVVPGKMIRIDSVRYNLLDSVDYIPKVDSLQALTLASLSEQVIKKNEPFSKPLISAELDRLSDVYRNNGYLRFSREQLLAVWDTVGVDLLRITFDPLEQAELLEALRRRRENPTADIEIRLRPDPDTSRLVRYYVGNVKVYPDFNSDTSYFKPKTQVLSQYQYQFVSYQGLFLPRKLIRFISLHRGDLYRQSNYLRTLNKFNSIGAWRLVTINQLPRAGTDTVDFEIRLIPANKYVTSITYDISLNQGNFSVGSLLGMGANFSLVNRNSGRAANQSTTNVRYGIELAPGSGGIQAQQIIASHTIQFPRLVPRMRWIPNNLRDDAKTFLNFNAGYTDRIDFYLVASVNTSWGYEFKLNKTVVGIRIPNIEYNVLTVRSGLQDLIDHNVSYKYIFNDGLVISSIVNVTAASGKKNFTTIKRASLEQAGLLVGLLRPLLSDNQLYRFVKLDAELVQTKIVRRTSYAWRMFAGAGYGLPFDSDDNINKYMPFFRQYYAGGPNSMRAWPVRKLGPGSTIRSFDKEIAPDRFGDIRLELNGEYRFYITQIFGFPSEGALFTDMGNVWFLRENPDFPDGEFSIKRLWKDVAIGVGTGFRIDFGFLKARLDYSFKAKNPSPDNIEAQNKWFYNFNPFGGQFQLGINYPF